MRRTPPVVVLVVPQPAMRAVVAWLVALAAAGLAFCVIDHESRVWSALFLVPVAAAWAGFRPPALPRRLRGDGKAWWLAEPQSRDETVVRLAVLIDLDAWLLLSANPGPRWLALARRQRAPRAPQPVQALQALHLGALRATLFAAPGGAVQR